MSRRRRGRLPARPGDCGACGRPHPRRGLWRPLGDYGVPSRRTSWRACHWCCALDWPRCSRRRGSPSSGTGPVPPRPPSVWASRRVLPAPLRSSCRSRSSRRRRAAVRRGPRQRAHPGARGGRDPRRRDRPRRWRGPRLRPHRHRAGRRRPCGLRRWLPAAADRGGVPARRVRPRPRRPRHRAGDRRRGHRGGVRRRRRRRPAASRGRRAAHQRTGPHRDRARLRALHVRPDGVSPGLGQPRVRGAAGVPRHPQPGPTGRAGARADPADRRRRRARPAAGGLPCEHRAVHAAVPVGRPRDRRRRAGPRRRRPRGRPLRPGLRARPGADAVGERVSRRPRPRPHRPAHRADRARRRAHA